MAMLDRSVGVPKPAHARAAADGTPPQWRSDSVTSVIFMRLADWWTFGVRIGAKRLTMFPNIIQSCCHPEWWPTLIHRTSKSQLFCTEGHLIREVATAADSDHPATPTTLFIFD
jgi:hypothetical protein